jgi:hypothetical protein
MTKDIASKLRSHLLEPLETEPDVLYFLAEARKLLERDDKEHTQKAIWLYCHWALHVDLTKGGATGEFMKTIDRWVTNTVAYLEPSGPWKFMEEVYLFRDFLYLDTLRKELKVFLVKYNIPTTLCENDDWWFKFLEKYGGIIEDGTLSMKAAHELGAVKKVTFKKGKELPDDNHVNFVIQWDIDLKDGRALRAEFEAFPEHPLKLTTHGLEVFNNGFIPPVREEPKK